MKDELFTPGVTIVDHGLRCHCGKPLKYVMSYDGGQVCYYHTEYQSDVLCSDGKLPAPDGKQYTIHNVDPDYEAMERARKRYHRSKK